LAVAGDYLFAGCADNTVKQWQISTVQFIRNFTGHTGNVWSIAINGQFLFSASVDFTVKQWQVAELCAAGRFWNGTACVNCPANQYSASVGNTVCVVCPAGQYSVAGSASCVACSLLWNGTMCINNGTSTTAITSRTTTTSVDPSAPSSVNFINSLFTDSTYQLVFFIATCAFGGIVLLLCLAVLIICLKQRKLGPNGKEQSMPRSSIGRPPTVAMFTQPQPAAEDFYYN
jgi:WD40 repeat protein